MKRKKKFTLKIKLIYKNQCHHLHLPRQRFHDFFQKFIKLGLILLLLERLVFC